MKSLTAILKSSMPVGSIVYLSNFDVNDGRSVYKITKLNLIQGIYLGNYIRGKLNRMPINTNVEEDLSGFELALYPYRLQK